MTIASDIIFDEKASRRIEAIYATPDVVAQRSSVLKAMALNPGERVLDIGSGPGYLAQSIGEQVGSTGQVQAIDVSESMCAIAQRRCADLPWISLKVADAVTLPFENNYFDVAVCSQVYEYLDNLDSALAELFRVLKPGGRVLVMDTDWGSIVWHSTDSQRMQRVLKAWDKHLVDPYLPRVLGPKLVKVGFDLIDVEVVPLLNSKYDPQTYSAGMMSLIAAFVHRHSELEEQEIEQWKLDLRQLGEQGLYFFSLNRYMFYLKKPD